MHRLYQSSPRAVCHRRHSVPFRQKCLACTPLPLGHCRMGRKTAAVLFGQRPYFRPRQHRPIGCRFHPASCNNCQLQFLPSRRFCAQTVARRLHRVRRMRKWKEMRKESSCTPRLSPWKRQTKSNPNQIQLRQKRISKVPTDSKSPTREDWNASRNRSAITKLEMALNVLAIKTGGVL